MKRLGICAGPLVAAAVLISGSALAATEVNTCGQVFSGNGFLSADLDCSGLVADAVTLQGGTLDLRGFTLTGHLGSGAYVVFCERSCTVVSEPPGGVVTGGSNGVGSTTPFTDNRAVNIKVIDAVVDANAFGIDTNRGRVTLTDATVSNSIARGVTCTSARLKNSTVSGNSVLGVTAFRIKIDDSVISGNGDGVGGGKTTIKRSSITGNFSRGITSQDRIKVVDSAVTGNLGPGIEGSTERIVVLGSDISANGEQGIINGFLGCCGKTIRVRDSTISNNAMEGIRNSSTRRAKLSNVTIEGNGLDGIYDHVTLSSCPLTVSASTITGNGTDLAVCGVSQTCSDISICELPKLSATTCDTSYDTNSGFPGTSLGVCALD